MFGEIVQELQPILIDCEEGFVSNFIVNFAYRKMHAGEVLQYGSQATYEIYIVWEGSIAVCETTEFEEPILVYTKGVAFNIYQILM